jgi:hypothetical protein
MPFAPTVLMRSSHTGAAAAGYRLVVSQRTRLCTIDGCLRAKVCPIMPPMERPTKCVSLIPRPSRRPFRSSDIWSSEYAPSGALV